MTTPHDDQQASWDNSNRVLSTHKSGESPFNNLQHTLTWFPLFPPIPTHQPHLKLLTIKYVYLTALPPQNCPFHATDPFHTAFPLTPSLCLEHLVLLVCWSSPGRL